MESVRKKCKLEPKAEEEEEEDLELLQQSILNECLCPVSESTLRKSFRGRHADSDQYSTIVTEWNHERILQFVSSVQLLCETAVKQNAAGSVCSRIGDVVDFLIRNEHGLIDQLIQLSGHNNAYICFVAGRALSAFFLVSRIHVEPRWLNQLTENALTNVNPSRISFSLEVIKRVVEWKDLEEHPLEEKSEGGVPGCHSITVEDPESVDITHIKCLCIKSLESKWPALVNRFYTLISGYSPSFECTIITFLDLWEAIISVKANLSVIDTKPFYANLEGFVPLLTSSIPPVIWKHILGLFNEVLCYGSTLALQDVLAEEPCTLAHLIVRSVKDWRLLDSLPYREGSGRFSGGAGDGDKPLLQKIVLLVLKAVAVTVKETRCESSSDSSLGSEAEDVDADMALIERSIREVLRQLDSCVKALLPFHPETLLATWVVQLLSDQDDALIEGMVCCMDVTVGLYRDSASPELVRVLNPSLTFIQFLRTVSHDTDVLLDLLVSNETCFLLYLLRLLKYVRRNWSEFVTTCGRDLDDVMSVLIRLRFSIDRLVSKDLFPYNINPVLRLLEKCEALYETSTV
ncbi:hypothetical protein WDU94_007752 [Cyamophila willieti]